MTQSQIPEVAARYGFDGHPLIAEVFHPDRRGWKRYPGRKRISASWARKLRRAGVTAVALTDGRRVADFRIEELTR